MPRSSRHAAELGQSVPPALPPLDPNRRYTIEHTNGYLSQSRAKTYKDIKAGRLKTIKDGKRNYVPGSEIIRRSTLPNSEPNAATEAAAAELAQRAALSKALKPKQAAKTAQRSRQQVA